eukprot:110204-Hanusia_phi.AAC.2
MDITPEFGQGDWALRLLKKTEIMVDIWSEWGGGRRENGERCGGRKSREVKIHEGREGERERGGRVGGREGC